MRNCYNPVRWFKQIKRTLSFDETTRLNPNQQSIGYTILTSTVVTQRSSIKDQRSTNILSIQRFFYYPCVRQYFYINHLYRKSTHRSVSNLSDYYKIARSFTLFSLRNACSYIILYRKYTRTSSTLLWNLMSRNLTSLRYKCQFLINIWSQNNQVKYHLFLSRQSGVYHCDLRPIGSRVTVNTREVLLRIMRVRHLVSWMKLFFHVPEM